MQILTGKHKGQYATLRQFANDWMTVDITGGQQGVIVKPTMVRLDDVEQQRMRNSHDAYTHDRNRSTGRFWAEWELAGDGTFTRRQVPTPAAVAG